MSCHFEMTSGMVEKYGLATTVLLAIVTYAIAKIVAILLGEWIWKRSKK